MKPCAIAGLFYDDNNVKMYIEDIMSIVVENVELLQFIYQTDNCLYIKRTMSVNFGIVSDIKLLKGGFTSMYQKVKRLGVTVLCFMILSTLAACAGSNTNTGSSNNAGSSPKATATPSASAEGATEESNVYPENGLPKDEKVTLKFAYWENGSGREWIDYAMDTFTKKFPNVEFETTYSPSIDTIIGTKISAGNDKDMFDIFSFNVPGGGAPLVEAGKIEPQDDLWDRKAYDNPDKTLRELQSGIYEGTGKIEGKVYALPYVQSVTGLFYNKNLFEEHGWNQNPKTWEEFVALIEEIKKQNIIPITYPGKFPGYLNFGFGVAQQFEVAEYTGNFDKYEDDYRNYRTPFYTSNESKTVYGHIYELGQKGAFPKGVAALSHTQSQMQLLQGQAAIGLTGEWVQNEMKDSIPDGFEWGFMLAPMGDSPDNAKYYQIYPSGGHFIWSAKPELNKQWAKEFIVWMWNLDVQQILAEKAGSLPVRVDFMNDQVLVDKLLNAPKAVLNYLKNNPTKGQSEARYVSRTGQYIDKLNIMGESLNDFAEGTKDPLPVLEAAEGFLNSAIAEGN